MKKFILHRRLQLSCRSWYSKFPAFYFYWQRTDKRSANNPYFYKDEQTNLFARAQYYDLETLAEGESGSYISIQKMEDTIAYSRRDIQENGESGFYESFVWFPQIPKNNVKNYLDFSYLKL